MAASADPTSAWVSSYSDKSDDWVLARLEFLENLERTSHGGSIPRRKKIRELRVEVLTRKRIALQRAALAAALPAPEVPVAAAIPTATG